MKAIFSILLVLILVVGCTSLKDRPANPGFSKLSQEFLDDMWKVHPSYASQLGLSEYDAILEIPDRENRQRRKQFYQSYLAKFKATDDDELSLHQQTDKKLIINQLQMNVWLIDEFKEYQWNPAIYNLGSAVSSTLEKQKRPLKDRFLDISEKLKKGPLYYQTAKNNIERPTKPHSKLAMKQTQGFIKYLKSDVLKQLQKAKLDKADNKKAKQRINATAAAAKRYVNFLRGVLAKPSQVGGLRSFRIGEELYAKKFAYQLQIESGPLELYRKALRAKEEARSKMFEAAIALYPKYYGAKLPPHDRQKVIKSIMQKVVKKHAKAEDFVKTVREQIPQLTEFVRKKDLLTLDPTRPLKVRETPLYQRGFAGASVDSPGPYDQKRDTYYNVTPLDDMSAKQKESYLREYNNYTLQILNIHEAIPGHYVQLVYSNKTPSLVKSIFGNGPMVEGWAVYAERMMLEEGYGENDPEMWLMYYKWFLRVVTNTIIDYELHNKGLSKKQAMKYMVEDAFQEKTEAEGKWHRATISQVQLASYFAGFSEIYQLRQMIKDDEGDDFNLKEFHEEFLSFGSAPVKEIKRLML